MGVGLPGYGEAAFIGLRPNSAESNQGGGRRGVSSGATLWVAEQKVGKQLGRAQSVYCMYYMYL